MKKNIILLFTILVVFVSGFQIASAQFPINIPKLPKIKKNKPETPKPEPTPDADNSQSNDNKSNDNETTDDSEETSKKTGECDDWWVSAMVDDIKKQQDEVDSFTPDRGWLVGTSTYNHLLFSVSPKARAGWFTESKAQFKDCPALVAAYKKLAASAAQKLPQFVPDKREYAIQNPALAKMMYEKIRNFSDHKVFYTGIKEANWLIDKNDFGIPNSRFKHGLVWVRYVPNDHPYCRIYWINLIQDYAGGGTYGATYAKFIEDDLAGCPSGK